MKNFIIGVDLGGTKISAGIIDKKGKVIIKLKQQTITSEGARKVIDDMINMVERLLNKISITTKDIEGIGIGACGPLDAKGGTVLSPPNLPGWDNVNIVEPFRERFNTKVYLNNDANCACLGEWYFGSGKGTSHMLYLTISTGIGGGIIINKQLYEGANNNAGEIGHHIIDPNGPLCGCGQRGCLEAFSSGTAIAKFAKEEVKRNKDTLILRLVNNDIDKITSEIVFESAKKNDKLALSIVDRASYYLGIGIGNVINIFNPEVIVLGGGVMKAGRIFLSPVKKYVKKFAFERLAKIVKILPAKLKDDVGIVGAACLILKEKE